MQRYSENLDCANFLRIFLKFFLAASADARKNPGFPVCGCKGTANFANRQKYFDVFSEKVSAIGCTGVPGTAETGETCQTAETGETGETGSLDENEDENEDWLRVAGAASRRSRGLFFGLRGALDGLTQNSQNSQKNYNLLDFSV